MTRSAFRLGLAVASQEGQTECGDDYLIRRRNGSLLVAVVDGLGHGPEAARAARIALATLEESRSDSPADLVLACHSALRKTRGVVMSLAMIRPPDGTITWLAVGNVECVLVHADTGPPPLRTSILQRGGVVGFQLPKLQAKTFPIKVGDTLIFATDGIDWKFRESIDMEIEPQHLADRIFDRFRLADDALVLVLRYGGEDL